MKVNKVSRLTKKLVAPTNMKSFWKGFQAVSLFLFLNIFQIAVAAAPSEPISPTQETLTELSSLEVASPFERNYQVMMVVVTAYSSTADQTDDTPWLTAANTPVRDGIVASNFLPLHTKIMIPELFGDKIFAVEDRMHERFTDRIDIWFPDRESAKNFGLRKATIQIL